MSKSNWKYADYKTAGICPSCKSKYAMHGVLCERCYERRQSPQAKVTQRRLVQRYKENNRSLGLCDRCKRPALTGLRECQVCNNRARAKRNLIRETVLAHYGQRCACCGEMNKQFLTIDHVKNDGHLEKKNGSYSGGGYASIIRRGFPSHYQVLCYNYNCAKGHYGICPHQMKGVKR